MKDQIKAMSLDELCSGNRFAEPREKQHEIWARWGPKDPQACGSVTTEATSKKLPRTPALTLPLTKSGHPSLLVAKDLHVHIHQYPGGATYTCV